MDIVSSMLDLMRRLPPTKIEENVEALMRISPDYADDLSGNVDQPLKLRVDRATGKEYLACVYNQDGESYRCVTRRSSSERLRRVATTPTINVRGVVPLHAAVQVALVQ
jgi:hypothetical protein